MCTVYVCMCYESGIVLSIHRIKIWIQDRTNRAVPCKWAGYAGFRWWHHRPSGRSFNSSASHCLRPGRLSNVHAAMQALSWPPTRLTIHSMCTTHFKLVWADL